ncbi:putative WD40 repeats [Lyophyllum shimeji]|uniref:WD40 repeats n=1 Tax=Lyophyllum shimeji TaxID=47721 RepID=A0A9P3PF80_LYOSH|nr:putative WD40 repeats [Lyophyllum shimeji]
MPPSDSEDETLEELEFEAEEDPEGDVEDDPLDVGPDDATEEGEEESASDESDDISDDEEDEENDPETFPTATMEVDAESETFAGRESPPSTFVPPPEGPPPVTRKRSLSPAQLRKKALVAPIGNQVPPGSYAVEAISALPHPAPTHALASSLCMTHLLTGSDDGYIRDYDVFAAVNGKGSYDAGGRIQSYQMLQNLTMHSDALWTAAGTDAGHINLFTTRHEPGRLVHVMPGHRGPVSGLALAHDEKGLFSAGWDGEAIHWDLNNGQRVRTFTAHGAQLTAIAVRPLSSGYSEPSSPVVTRIEQSVSQTTAGSYSSETMTTGEPALNSDAKSDASFDPLFDDEADAPDHPKVDGALQNPQTQYNAPRATQSQSLAPKNAPPLLDPASYATFSPDLLLTASIDGQVILWDRRANTPGSGVGRLWMSEKTPPWCLSACWSADGGQVYAGRRNGTVDVWDIRQLGRSGPSNTPRLLKTLRNPPSSGVVSCVVAFPDCRHIACASIDNLRLWNVAEAAEPDSFGKTKGGVQFKIIPGHHGGYISQMLIDPGARFLVSASSNRGWHGDSTRTVFVHDIKRIQ